MKESEESTMIAELRRVLEKERARIDARLELLDQYDEIQGEELLEDAPPPPPPRKKRTPAAEVFKKKPKKTPAKKRAPKKPPPRLDKGPASDKGPVACGFGKSEIRSGSNMEKIVSILIDKAPHWMTHTGISEAAKEMGSNVPKTFSTVINQECAKLRKNKYYVPGLEWKTVGNRIEYRITTKTAG